MFLIAWRNLVADKVRLAVTLAGVAFAALLMIFEGSLLVGFGLAASNIVNASEADVWISAHGVPAFDLPAPLPERLRHIVRGIDGVQATGRIVAGFTAWVPPSGQAHTVLLIGTDRGINGSVPHPDVGTIGTGMYESAIVDESNARDLGAVDLPVEVEIGFPRRRATVRAITSGFGTFLGPPYVFTDYEDAVRYLGVSPNYTSFIAARLRERSQLQTVKSAIAARVPEVDVWSADDFAWQSSWYWLVQTGAGGALMTAAVLGFLVGLVIVAQNMYAITLQHIEEFATLKALGASNANIATIVALQALITGVVGTALGMALAAVGVRYAAALIPWIFMPAWLVGVVGIIGVGMCLIACLVAVRPAMAVDPATVFRA